MKQYELRRGDCLSVMRGMAASSVDAIVTDPPYGLGFMGKEWDHSVPGEAYWREALRVAKPGAHLLCFGGTRTFHRMACAIEDAGWEIRDTIMWVYGSGFPKSMDVGKAIDKAPAEPAGNEAKMWDGWGTCLKPAWEPIIVARKPLDGTVAHNVMEHGTGAINIDACRVPTVDSISTHSASKLSQDSQLVYGTYGEKETHQTSGQKLGRFPANLVHDGSDEVVALFPDSKGQAGAVRGDEPSRVGQNGIYGTFSKPSNACEPRGDSGSAARFFNTLRDGEESASRTYADRGGTNFAAKPGMRREPTSADRFFYCAKASKRERGEGNDHPTVKPTALMSWLVRLVTRKDGTVLDPFCGSGSTGMACAVEGDSFIGIEMNEHYADIAEKRLAAAYATS